MIVVFVVHSHGDIDAVQHFSGLKRRGAEFQHRLPGFVTFDGALFGESAFLAQQSCTRPHIFCNGGSARF